VLDYIIVIWGSAYGQGMVDHSSVTLVTTVCFCNQSWTLHALGIVYIRDLEVMSAVDYYF
jgi:hypothetical protein